MSCKRSVQKGGRRASGCCPRGVTQLIMSGGRVDSPLKKFNHSKGYQAKCDPSDKDRQDPLVVSTLFRIFFSYSLIHGQYSFYSKPCNCNNNVVQGDLFQNSGRWTFSTINEPASFACQYSDDKQISLLVRKIIRRCHQT